MSNFHATVTLDALTLRSILAATATAKAKDGARYGLDSVFVEVTPSSVEFVATDGSRLHSAKIQTNDATGEVVAILNGEGIDRLCKALKSVKVGKRATEFPTATLRIAPQGALAEIRDPNGNSASVALPATYRASDYPNFRAVIPKRDPEAKGSYFGVDPAFLSEAAVCAGQIADTARIQPGDTAVSPVLITAESGETTFLAVVMPRRLA